MNRLKQILAEFTPVSLSDIEEVKLMNRIDRKYWFYIHDLEPLINEILPFYNILEIDGHRLMEYQTCYFDTPGNIMYLQHHNRSLPRYKVRKREYLTTGGDFLEIKLKTNKKVTIKKRVESSLAKNMFSDSESSFINAHTPYMANTLVPSLQNRFYRITFTHKEKLDRITIDFSPEFSNGDKKIRLENLAIFELKRGHSLKSSPVISIIRSLKIRHRGLSKYCTGKALLDTEIKKNAFKPRLRYLTDKILFSNLET